jgi:hypothetical protein
MVPERVSFKRGLSAGQQKALVDGREIADLAFNEYAGVWQIDPDMRLGMDLGGVYTSTLRAMKEYVRDSVAHHTGKSVWHAPLGSFRRAAGDRPRRLSACDESQA